MQPPAKPQNYALWKKFAIDSLLFVAFLLVFNTHLTGKTIHEWLGMAMGAVIIVHLLLSWNWIVGITKKFFSKLKAATRINYLLNLLLFVDFTLVIMTGILISESAMKTLGIELPHDEGWKQVHLLTSDWAIYLTGIHLALNWRWVIHTLKTLIRKPTIYLRGRAIALAGGTK
ncbi:MAG: DUF4405 domain-containing protein [Anaerolineales bacterium]